MYFIYNSSHTEISKGVLTLYEVWRGSAIALTANVIKLSVKDVKQWQWKSAVIVTQGTS